MDNEHIKIVRKSGRWVHLRVYPDCTVEVTAPPSVDVRALLSRHAGWIENKRSFMRSLIQGHEGKESLFLYNGHYYHLIPGASCTIDEPAGAICYNGARNLKKAMEAWLRAELRERAERIGTHLSVQYGRITIRMQKTRWGSCSSKGNLNFNLRMLALPEDLREYLVVHEMAHLRIPNHSHAFWELVSDLVPDYAQAEDALKRYWMIVDRNDIWSVLSEIRIN